MFIETVKNTMRITLLFFFVGLVACQSIRLVDTNSVTIKAEVFGLSASGENKKYLMLSHDGQSIGDRLVELKTAAPIYNLIDLKLKVDSSTGIEPFPEEFVLLSISSAKRNDQSLGKSWSRDRIGDVVVLRVRKDDISLDEVQYSSFPVSGHQRRPGAHYLARIEDADRKLPWKVMPGSPNCRPIDRKRTWYTSPTGETDCFDLETLAGTILANLSVSVSEGLWDSNESPIDLNASGHSLYIVPHVTFNGDKSDIPGFGFIYQVEITGAAFHVTLQVPVSFLYRNLEMIIDPLSEGFSEFQNKDRIRVISHSLPGDFSLELIKSIAENALENIELPKISFGELPNGEPKEEPLDFALRLLIESSAVGSRPILGSQVNRNTSLIALPKQRTTIDSTTNNKVMFIQSLTKAERVPTNLDRVTISRNQVVIVKEITSYGLNRERIITISGMSPLTPYDLYFLGE